MVFTKAVISFAKEKRQHGNDNESDGGNGQGGGSID
jgi:hypothetical protein